jgi:hypothetical protein
MLKFSTYLVFIFFKIHRLHEAFELYKCSKNRWTLIAKYVSENKRVHIPKVQCEAKWKEITLGETVIKTGEWDPQEVFFTFLFLLYL